VCGRSERRWYIICYHHGEEDAIGPIIHGGDALFMGTVNKVCCVACNQMHGIGEAPITVA